MHEDAKSVSGFIKYRYRWLERLRNVPLPSTREDPVDVKFLVVTLNIYGT